MKNLILQTVFIAATGVFLGGTGFAQRQIENLNRGVVAVKKSSTQVYVSWRLFGNDPTTVGFNLFRVSASGTTQLLANHLTTTDYTDTPANLSTTTYSYFVRPVINGVEQVASESASIPATTAVKSYLSLPLRTDTGPNGPYDVKFAWVGDLDGDGDFDYVVDRLSTLGAYEQFLEAYTNDGTFLWRMAMGPNSVNQYAYEPGSSAISIGDTDNVTVYDMDGDGKAEVMVRSANGVTVKNAAGTQVASITDASNSTQFLSVIDGLSGTELGRATMPNAWAQHGTQTNKAMIAYLDGKRPSVVMYGYNRASTGAFYRQFTAFDYRNGAITQRWTLAQDQSVLPGGEGHQIRIADVDNDGKDEICDLGHVIDDNGTQLFNNELVHGDRFHIADLDPDRPGLETYAIQQYNPTMLATALSDAGTGRMIKKWYSNGLADVGRGIALELTAAHKGYEMYSTQPGIFNAKGQQISANNLWAPEGLWWDGDLAREFIDGAGSGALNPVVNKFNPATGAADRMFSIYNDNGAYSTHQAYGGRPAFWGDILGDWREEIVLVASDYSELRIYTTTAAATNRLYTLMHNPQYRCQTTTKGYVQASYVDYYLGYNMPTAVPPPAMISSTLTWASGTAWDAGISSSWKNASGSNATFVSGNSVLFDISGSNASSIALTGTLTPSAVSFFNPQDFTLSGTGSLSGSMALSKSGAGKTTLIGSHPYTGSTTIWDGALVVNGNLSASNVTVWGGTWGGSLAVGATGGRLAGTGTISQAVSLQYRGAITPGSGMSNAATIALGSSLTAADGSVLALDLSDDPTGVSKPNDRITVAGNLSLSGTVAIAIKALNTQLLPGTYTLLTYGGTLTGSVANLAVTVPDGTPYTLAVGSGAITLTIPVTRAPASLVWTGGNNGNAWNIATTPNWSRAGSSDTFVSGDTVTFDATGAANSSVNLTVAVPVAGVVVNSTSNYAFTGNGAIAGSGGLTKSGTGTLTLSNTNTYTGPTTINGGTLAVDNLNDGGSPSSIGSASTAATNLVLSGGGTLSLVGLQTNTNRSLTLGTGGGTLSIPNASTSLQISGSLVGAGSLTKTGAGSLILAATNSYSGGTFISAGTVTLASDNVNVSGLGSGIVTLNGGTLSMTDNDDISSSATSSWPINVPAGFSGRLNADSRCTLAGPLTGGGDFTFYTPFIRTDLTGNWSAFTGRIGVVSDADGGDFRIKNTAGYPSAQLDLGAEIYAFYNNTSSSNLTIPVGALSGVATSYLAGGLSAGWTITWEVGARNQSTTFAGIIANNTGPSALTKVGTGTLTLTGASTYTGATSVSAGRLQINGSTSATNYTVQSGATLGGSGTITGNVTVLTGGALEHGLLSATSLTITGNLTLPSTVVVRPTAGAAAPGTYTVLTYSGTLTGTPTFAWEAPAGSYLIATFDSSVAGTVKMTLTEPPRIPGPITWTGASNFNWDTATTNWLADGVAVAFQNGDSPTFTDSGIATSAINLGASVQPTAVIVASTKNYTISGVGLISGTSTLTKSGTGTLLLTSANNYSGGTTLTGGKLFIGTGNGVNQTAAIGSGPLAMSNGATFRMNTSSSGTIFPGNNISIAAGATAYLESGSTASGYGGIISTGDGFSNLVINSASVNLSSANTKQFGSGFTGTVNVGTGAKLNFRGTISGAGNGGDNATFNVTGTGRIDAKNAGNLALGALSGNGVVAGSETASTTLTYTIGAKGMDSIFSGTLIDAAVGRLAAIIKTGSGTQTLSGTNSYTGATTINAGKLLVTGSLAATPVTVTTTGTLGGTGTLAGAVTCNGTLAPGVTAGTLSLSSGLTLGSTSSLNYDLGSTSDLTAVTGILSLDGTVNVTAAPGLVSGNYTLITYTGVLTNNTLNVGTLPPGCTATLNVDTLNSQVKLTMVVPVNAAPQITAGPTASANPVTTTSTNLSVTATDDAGEASLTYTWSATGPAAVSFSPNGTNAAKSTTATFTAPGSYTLTATARDVPGLAAANSINITVTATPTTLTVSPSSATLAVDTTQPFTAVVRDQFGTAVSNPSITWSTTGGGTISAGGLYTATTAGSFQVTSTSGSLSSSVPVTVTKAAASVTLGNLVANYDGTQKSASAMTTPASLTVGFTYDGSATAPTAAGTYAVVATISDANYAGSASGNLVISRVPISITWTGTADYNWNTTANNWSLGAASVSYQPGDTVSFTDPGAAASAVSLAANVQPAALIVNAATKNYTISGAGQITGTATLTKSGAGILTLSGIHTYSGGTTMNGGFIQAKAQSIGSGALFLTGGQIEVGWNDTPQTVYSGTNSFTLDGGKLYVWDGIQHFAGNFSVTANGGALGSTWNDAGTDQRGLYLDGLVSGSGPLTINHTFSGADPWTTSFVNFTNNLNTYSGTVSVTPATTSGANGTVGGNYLGIGAQNTLANATVDLPGNNTGSRFGTSPLVFTEPLPAAAMLGGLSGSGRLVLTEYNVATHAYTANPVALSVGNNNSNTSYSGIISGGGSLVKVGSGQLSLAAAQTFTGGTTVSAGKLVINGSLASGAVSIATTGTLGGNGTIAGAVACNGSLTPGVAVGTLNFSAGLTLATTSTLDYDLGTTSDRSAVTGNLTLDGTVNVNAATGFASGNYILVTYTGTLTNNILNVGTVPAGFTATVNTATAGQVRLVVAPVNVAPQISVAASASPSNVTTTTTSLAVAATDDAGEGNLTYTWSGTGPAAVSFSPNGSNAAKNATATFTAPGSYTFTATVRDVPGLTATSSTIVTVTATPAAIAVSPSSATLAVNDALGFSAAVSDQFGNSVSNPSITWSAAGGGTISAAGLFTATNAGGPWQITATSGSLSSNVPVTVTKAAATVTLGNLSATYNGTPKSASATTSPAGLAVSFTYAGSATAPTNAGTYAVIATINNANYAGSTSGSLVISARTFGNWAEALFSPAQIAAGESAPNADPDHDGLTNLAEYALGGSPHGFTPPPVVTFAAASMSILFTRPASIGDVIYHAEVAPDFVRWTGLTLHVLNPGADPESVRATFTFPGAKPPESFIRLRFEK